LKVFLKDIAIIYMGYSFRARLESKDAGTVAVIQMKDLTDDNTVSCANLAYVDMDNFNDNHFVRMGDLIFRSRSLSSTSAILATDPGPAVLSSPLLKIRITDPSVMPEYVNWYISQLPAQIFLASHARGTTQKMINKEALEMLEIDVPPLEKQKAIVALAALADEEQRILKQLAQKRKQLISALLIRKTQENK
jgi:restriction endonuclease S subunit